MTVQSVTVESEVIRAAMTYAVGNGYEPTDRTAIGLILAGMAIMAACSPAAQRAMLTGYLKDLPAAETAIRAWAAGITRAVGV